MWKSALSPLKEHWLVCVSPLILDKLKISITEYMIQLILREKKRKTVINYLNPLVFTKRTKYYVSCEVGIEFLNKGKIVPVLN
jgi:hypothetical protein